MSAGRTLQLQAVARPQLRSGHKQRRVFRSMWLAGAASGCTAENQQRQSSFIRHSLTNIFFVLLCQTSSLSRTSTSPPLVPTITCSSCSHTQDTDTFNQHFHRFPFLHHCTLTFLNRAESSKATSFSWLNSCCSSTALDKSPLVAISEDKLLDEIDLDNDIVNKNPGEHFKDDTKREHLGELTFNGVSKAETADHNITTKDTTVHCSLYRIPGKSVYLPNSGK